MTIQINRLMLVVGLICVAYYGHTPLTYYWQFYIPVVYIVYCSGMHLWGLPEKCAMLVECKNKSLPYRLVFSSTKTEGLGPARLQRSFFRINLSTNHRCPSTRTLPKSDSSNQTRPCSGRCAIRTSVLSNSHVPFVQHIYI